MMLGLYGDYDPATDTQFTRPTTVSFEAIIGGKAQIEPFAELRNSKIGRRHHIHPCRSDSRSEKVTRMKL